MIVTTVELTDTESMIILKSLDRLFKDTEVQFVDAYLALTTYRKLVEARKKGVAEPDDVERIPV